ncbi:MAG: hypothetical protein ACE5J3_07450 [Methanosarcinales archaeon]
MRFIVNSSFLIFLSRKNKLHCLKKLHKKGFEFLTVVQVKREVVDKILASPNSYHPLIVESSKNLKELFELKIIQVVQIDFVKHSKIIDQARKSLAKLDKVYEHEIGADPLLIGLLKQEGLPIILRDQNFKKVIKQLKIESEVLQPEQFAEKYCK